MTVESLKYYTVKELSEILRMSRELVGIRIHNGEFGETLNPSPKVHLVSEANLKAYIARHTSPAYTEKKAIIRLRHHHSSIDVMAKI